MRMTSVSDNPPGGWVLLPRANYERACYAARGSTWLCITGVPASAADSHAGPCPSPPAWTRRHRTRCAESHATREHRRSDARGDEHSLPLLNRARNGSWVRRLLDTRDTDIFVSGSSAKLLSREGNTSLRGRAMEVLIHPSSLSTPCRGICWCRCQAQLRMAWWPASQWLLEAN